MKNIKQNKIEKSAITAAAITALIIFLSGILIWQGYLFASTRIYPFVSINGAAVGGKTVSEAKELLNTKYDFNTPVTVVYQGKSLDVDYEDLGIEVGIDRAVYDAYQTGRSSFKGLDNKIEVTIDDQKFTSYLKQDFPEVNKEPLDAKFTISKEGKLEIAEGVSGQTFNTPAMSLEIINGILDNKIIEIKTRENPALLTAVDLQPLLSESQSKIDAIPKLKFGTRYYEPNANEKLSFINLQVVDGFPKVTLSSEAIHVYLNNLKDKTATKAVADSYYPDGELSKHGRPGVSINVNESEKLVTTAMAGGKKSIVSLPSIEVAQDRKVVEKPYTPGLFEGKYIEVDLSTQQLFQFEGDKLIAIHRVSTGKWSTPTPIGTFDINFKHPRAFSKTYKLYMPYWMAFIGTEYGLHELPEWPSGAKEGQSHLGTAVSHGCIRLGVGAAAAVYDWAEVGTKVVVHK